MMDWSSSLEDLVTASQNSSWKTHAAQRSSASPPCHGKSASGRDDYRRVMIKAYRSESQGDRCMRTASFAISPGHPASTRWALMCRLVYTKAYACYALKCAIAPEIPNNAASLAPFEIAGAGEYSIVNAHCVPRRSHCVMLSVICCPIQFTTRSTRSYRTRSFRPKARVACVISRSRCARAPMNACAGHCTVRCGSANLQFRRLGRASDGPMASTRRLFRPVS